MDIKKFLESCPIGKTIELECKAELKDRYIRSFDGIRTGRKSSGPREWVIPSPRIRIYCSECDGVRGFNPAANFPLSISCLNIGRGPGSINLGDGRSMETGRHADQFLRYVCADCAKEEKKYSLAVEILNPLKGEEKVEEISIKLTKYGEIPKPIKPINPKIKRLIKTEWELYRKGADDEAAGNGIGAFAYYRRVVEASRDMILDAMCVAATKLNVSEEDIAEIQATKKSKNFTDSIKSVDHLFPSELKFNDQNALTVLYGPLSAGIHERSDEDCLAAAAHIRTLLDALGERLEQVIDQEEKIQDALKNLREFSSGVEAG